MRSDPIAVFAYAFPHRKTQDFLFELVMMGFSNLCVIAAPWKDLGHIDRNRYFPQTLQTARPHHPADICRALGLNFHEIAHDDVESIKNLKKRYDFELGIISGARILRRKVIDLFPIGILNIHPGKLPETAGLDLFYQSIVKNVPLGATAHFIDSKVDAGDELFFVETHVDTSDTPEIVSYNNYQNQLLALHRFVRDMEAGDLLRRPIENWAKNQPMTPEEKRQALQKFSDWKLARQVESAKSLWQEGTKRP
jgi:phosphoribosylglycinamide formyltransferase-1